MEVCDCGAAVPVEAGPVHAYLSAAPACWRMYGELGAEGLPVTHVDCFAAQHARGAAADRRQRSSVAVHLVALCLHLEHGLAGPDLMRARQRTSATVLPAAGIRDWPVLDPPADLGPVTVPGLYALPPAERADVVQGWAGAVWTAWRAEHDVVRAWAGLMW